MTTVHVKPCSGRQQVAVAQDANGLRVPGARQFRRVARGPQKFQTPGEAGHLVARHGGGHGVTGGKPPCKAPGLTDGSLVISKAPQPAASASVIADLEGRVRLPSTVRVRR